MMSEELTCTADVLGAGRVHVDVWVAGQQDRGAESSTVRRRLSALSSFYRYCAAHDLADRIPTAGVARPMVDPDYTATIGLDRDQARALVAAADADRGPQALRTAAVIRLLLHNALRVDEACAADVADLVFRSGDPFTVASNRVDDLVGTMWCAYAFTALALVSLPSAIASHNAVTLVSWISQTFLQLVLLSVIIVGQNVLAAAADKRSEATYNDADAVLHEAVKIQEHLVAQDKVLSALIDKAQGLPG